MITAFDTTDLPTKIAAEVKNFDPLEHFIKKDAKKMDRFTQFAVASSKMAYTDSGLDFKYENEYRIGVCIGTGIGGISVSVKHNSTWNNTDKSNTITIKT